MVPLTMLFLLALKQLYFWKKQILSWQSFLHLYKLIWINLLWKLKTSLRPWELFRICTGIAETRSWYFAFPFYTVDLEGFVSDCSIDHQWWGVSCKRFFTWTDVVILHCTLLIGACLSDQTHRSLRVWDSLLCWINYHPAIFFLASVHLYIYTHAYI